MHEAALAVRAVKPEAYMAYMSKVYDSQEQFSDAATWDKSRAQVSGSVGG
jgi:protein-disulfide isomerase